MDSVEQLRHIVRSVITAYAEFVPSRANVQIEKIFDESNDHYELIYAAWPGLVGKGPDSEPAIELDKMIEMTAAASVDGQKFDGMDLFLFLPHVAIDIDDDGIKKIAEKFQAKGLKVGSVVAPVWPPT